jgi:hypothetical protein
MGEGMDMRGVYADLDRAELTDLRSRLAVVEKERDTVLAENRLLREALDVKVNECSYVESDASGCPDCECQAVILLRDATTLTAAEVERVKRLEAVAEAVNLYKRAGDNWERLLLGGSSEQVEDAARAIQPTLQLLWAALAALGGE